VANPAQSPKVLPTASSTVNIDAILATIRQLESGNYTQNSRAATDGATGAYQFEGSTWRSELAAIGGNPNQYPQAWQAPKAVQDAVAANYVQRILASTGGNVGDVPVIWYVGSVPSNLNYVPYPSAGNTLTVAQYRSNWLNAYGKNAKLSPAQLAAIGSTSGAQLTSFPGSGVLGNITGSLGGLASGAGSVAGTLFDPLNIFGGAIQTFTAPVRIFLALLSNWQYILQFIIGGWMVVIGGIIVLLDSGALSKAPVPVPIPV
jgi:hypothetical protein